MRLYVSQQRGAHVCAAHRCELHDLDPAEIDAALCEQGRKWHHHCIAGTGHLRTGVLHVDAFNFNDMVNRDYIRAFVRRTATLAAFVALLWVIQIINWLAGYGLNPTFGLIPRHISGLDGIIASPLLHGSFAHLMANTPPLLVMGGLLAATATRALLAVNAVVIGTGGGLVWLFGSTAIHIGASGLIFGWFGFLVARGLVDRSPVTLGAALLTGFLYGSILWGVLPGQPGVSWEAHLFGAIAGAVAALLIRTHVHAPRFGGVTGE